MRSTCRWRWLLCSVAFLVASFCPASADEARFVRLGTGPTGGTYFPVGALIANTLSGPPGSMACEMGGSCGVPGLIVSAVSTQGSIDNMRLLAKGAVDLALCQADVAHDAATGTGPFAGRPADSLRSIANLFAEPLHVVVRRADGMRDIRALKGRRVALGETNAGTPVTARTVLRAFGIGLSELVPVFEKPSRSAEELAAGGIDGFLAVGGEPLPAVSLAAERTAVALLPVAGREAERILAAQPFLVAAVLPAETYPGVPATPTVAVGAQLLVAASAPDDLVWALTRALWDSRNRKVLDAAGPIGRRITLPSALDRLGAPLHPGAARWYREAGILPATERTP